MCAGVAERQNQHSNWRLMGACRVLRCMPPLYDVLEAPPLLKRFPFQGIRCGAVGRGAVSQVRPESIQVSSLAPVIQLSRLFGAGRLVLDMPGKRNYLCLHLL